MEAAAACLHLNADGGHGVILFFCFFFLQQRQFNKLCLRRLQSIRPRNQQESFYRVAKTAAHKKGGKMQEDDRKTLKLKMSLHPSPPARV